MDRGRRVGEERFRYTGGRDEFTQGVGGGMGAVVGGFYSLRLRLCLVASKV